MKLLFATMLSLMLGFSAATAEEGEPAEDGFDLMQEGARMLMRGLMAEVEPTLDELRDSLDEIGPALDAFADAVGPAFVELLGQIDDFTHYEAPEILPNGDIIIRRKPDAPNWDASPETGPIDL